MRPPRLPSWGACAFSPESSLWTVWIDGGDQPIQDDEMGGRRGRSSEIAIQMGPVGGRGARGRGRRLIKSGAAQTSTSAGKARAGGGEMSAQMLSRTSARPVNSSRRTRHTSGSSAAAICLRWWFACSPRLQSRSDGPSDRSRVGEDRARAGRGVDARGCAAICGANARR